MFSQSSGQPPVGGHDSSLEIHHQDQLLFRTLLGKTRFQAAFDAKQGDTLDFVIHAESQDWGDSTDILIGIWKYD